MICWCVAAIGSCLSVLGVGGGGELKEREKEMLSHSFTLVFKFQVWKFSILSLYQ